MLALAHYVERLVEEGTLASYADAARQLGVSGARMSQILNLLNLPPRVQQALLLGDLHLSERRRKNLHPIRCRPRRQKEMASLGRRVLSSVSLVNIT